uniref:Malic enzyme n=2 Tax=Poaceae TaxID=4479 RepID=A0A0D9UXQ7_9ORYZ
MLRPGAPVTSTCATTRLPPSPFYTPRPPPSHYLLPHALLPPDAIPIGGDARTPRTHATRHQPIPAASRSRRLLRRAHLAAMLSARTAATTSPLWKRGGGSEGGSSGNGNGKGSGCTSCREVRRRRAAAVRVRAASPRRVEAVAMESAAETEKEVVAAAGGGVEDKYGEDRATEEVPVTPWAFSVASGYTLLRDPHHNKGLAFTEKERDAHYLRGLLPPAVVSQDLQVKKIMHNLRQYSVPLQRYMAMMDLQERNERLFYKLLIDNVEELLPVVYTPTVGEACQKYGSIFRQPQGLYVSLRDKGKVLDVLRNWPERNIQCLPITIDVGTNNEQLLNDEFYIGLRQRRATGKEYHELMEEFMSAVKQIYGEKVLIQFEDFANHNAFDLLAKYSKSHLVFNDDIQAGTGIAELIALEISKQTKAPLEECRKKVWLLDSKGLIVNSRKDSLQSFKKPWAHDHEPVATLLDAVQSIKPTVLIGTSGVGRTFTKEVVEAMASFNERPIIFSLSNPTSHSECTAEEAYNWSQGRAVFASGSPFDPVEYNGKIHVPGQANNAYIFPGFGLGVVISGAVRVHEDMLLAASEALADQSTQENFEKGSIFPPFTDIRKISARIAAKVAAKAYELGLATRLPQPRDLEKYAESCMYTPVYRSYR